MNSKDCTSSELATISANATAGTRTYDASAGNGTYEACVVDSCTSGYVKRNNDCEVPGNGKYAHTDGSEKDCVTDGKLTSPTGGTFVTPAGGRTMAQSCDFICPTGKVRNAANRSCDNAGQGTYVVNNAQHNCWPGSRDSATELSKQRRNCMGFRPIGSGRCNRL